MNHVDFRGVLSSQAALDAYMGCLTQHRDNRGCCRRHGVPRKCLMLCGGEQLPVNYVTDRVFGSNEGKLRDCFVKTAANKGTRASTKWCFAISKISAHLTKPRKLQRSRTAPRRSYAKLKRWFCGPYKAVSSCGSKRESEAFLNHTANTNPTDNIEGQLF